MHNAPVSIEEENLVRIEAWQDRTARTLLQERVCLAGKVPQYLAACFPRLSTFTVELDIAQTKPGILRPPSRSDEQEI